MVCDNAHGVKKEVLEKGFFFGFVWRAILHLLIWKHLEKLIWQDIMKINLYQLVF